MKIALYKYYTKISLISIFDIYFFLLILYPTLLKVKLFQNLEEERYLKIYK